MQSIKSTVKARAEKKTASGSGQYGEGIHEAIVDIVKAMKSSMKGGVQGKWLKVKKIFDK
ncbi:hypothetical protein [Desulfatitalea alkaliphila]|uniref:Uncharacterized protein n=1 Tax=Desulfatitalea alkaliphila TaxID=2929485 RepID=A0AA41UJ51_9BACT|nr:hypothetical protein [Desulfatitalea alkaliphila]MCJ8499006.1 hypothetical protein [Desulfatitalea alkaliphila]